MRYWKIATRFGQEEEKENLGYRIDQVKNAWPLTGKENKFFLELTEDGRCSRYNIWYLQIF